VVRFAGSTPVKPAPPTSEKTRGRPSAPARGLRGITFALALTRQEVQMPRFIPFLVLALAIVGTPENCGLPH
jgi:hypothetical protein